MSEDDGALYASLFDGPHELLPTMNMSKRPKIIDKKIEFFHAGRCDPFEGFRGSPVTVRSLLITANEKVGAYSDNLAFIRIDQRILTAGDTLTIELNDIGIIKLGEHDL